MNKKQTSKLEEELFNEDVKSIPAPKKIPSPPRKEDTHQLKSDKNVSSD